MAFPLKPILDEVIVREIPLKEYFEFDKHITEAELDNENFKFLSDRGVVEAVGAGVTAVQVGDVVQFNEFCRYNEIYLNPAHRNRTDLPHYFKIRVSDLDGVVGKSAERIVGTDAKPYRPNYGMNWENARFGPGES